MKYFTSKNKRIRNLKGFTFLELIVTLAMFGILSTILFIGYPKTNNILIFDKASYEIASIYKSAQVLGASRGGTARGDGVYTDITSNQNHIIEFLDNTDPNLPKDKGIPQSNRYYTSIFDTRVKDNYLTKNIFIESISLVNSANVRTDGLTRLSVVYVRPEQVAHITTGLGTPTFRTEYDKALVQIRSRTLTKLNVKCLIIYKLGQISLEDGECSLY